MSQVHQPTHHRPSMSQSDVSRSAPLESDLSRMQNAVTYEDEPFSYDPAHLREWYMKEDLWAHLPADLNAALVTWQAAGAAVCTAMTRIEELHEERLTRGWLDKTRAHHSRTASKSSSFPHSPPATPITSAPNGVSPPTTAVSSTTQPEPGTTPVRPHSPKGAHTPPLTPADIQARTPSPKPKLRTDSLISVTTSLHDQLSAALTVSTSSPPATPTTEFDEAAWTVYTNAYRAELDDLRANNLVRMRHFGRVVERIGAAAADEEAMRPTAKAEFDAWWLGMGRKIRRYEGRAAELGVPGIEEVREERMMMSLSL
ncbi:hypothetical protein LTR50_005009 [Elasticomyces elasticus]|nr:hypothetical protein LTR50_005009 [Elasticomyces elasticus]